MEFDLDSDLFAGIDFSQGKKQKVKEQSPAEGYSPAEWLETACVILIHEQECLACGNVSSFSHGFFTEKLHVRDKTARQLVAGHPIGSFPVLVERVRCSSVPVCSNCAESHALIENACRNRVP